MGLDALIQGNIRPPQGIFDQSPQQKADLGHQLPFADGRVYKYAKAGEGLTMGQLVQAPIIHTTYDHDLVVAVAGKAIDRQLAVTMPDAKAAFAANAYEGGFLLIEEGTEQGLMRKIKSHDAFTSAAAATVIFKFKDLLKEAIAISGHFVAIVKSPYYGAMINNATDGITSTDGRCIGVAPIDVTSTYYFWLQVRGLGPGLMENSAIITVGEALTCDGPAVVKREATAGFPLVGHAASYGAQGTTSIMVYYCFE